MPALIAIRAFLKLVPWWAYVGLAAALVLWWLVADDRHYRALSASQAVTIDQVKDEQAKATIAAQKAHDAQEQRYKDLANAADTKHAEQAAIANDATDRYIADHRVPACPAGRAASPAIAGAKDRDTDIPASMPTDSVLVSPDDVRACTGAVTYALGAQKWALELSENAGSAVQK